MAVRPDAIKRLVGSTVIAVEPVGKHLLIRFDSGLALHSHMRMRGAWHLYRPGERWRRPDWQLKAMLETDGVVAVCFAALSWSWSGTRPRRWGIWDPTSSPMPGW